MTAVAVDAHIAGRYRLVELIGTGGMGSVWRAEDEILRRPVAIKLLREEVAADEASRSRFRIEAQAAASINHPNVVAVYDYGELATTTGECLSYVVMELVWGRALSDALAERSRLDPPAVASILEQAALGLSAAHRQGIVHRDIKPGNILLSRNGAVKIADFGIARIADAAPLTRTGTMLGTAQYLAPEQASGSGATAASDLYSLGVVAYTCLTGSPPFDGDSAVATVMAHLHNPVPPLPAGVPARLAQLVTQLLAKRPERRPASAEEVAARAAAAVRAEHTEVLPSAAVAGGSLAGLMRRHRRPLIALPVLGVIAAIIAFSLPAGATPRVPSVKGDSESAALLALRHAGYKATVHRADAARQRAGVVLSQSPSGGQTLGRGHTVALTVSSGTVEVNPTQFQDQPFTKVAGELTALGVIPSESLVYSSLPAGTVVGIAPSGEITVGSTVVVQVAQAAPQPAPPAPHKHGGHDH